MLPSIVLFDPSIYVDTQARMYLLSLGSSVLRYCAAVDQSQYFHRYCACLRAYTAAFGNTSAH